MSEAKSTPDTSAAGLAALLATAKKAKTPDGQPDQQAAAQVYVHLAQMEIEVITKALSMTTFAKPSDRHMMLRRRAAAFCSLKWFLYAYGDLLAIPDSEWTKEDLSRFMMCAVALDNKPAIEASKLKLKDDAKATKLSIPLTPMNDVAYSCIVSISPPTFEELRASLQLPPHVELKNCGKLYDYGLFTTKDMTKGQVLFDEEPFCTAFNNSGRNCWKCITNILPPKPAVRCSNCRYAIYCSHACLKADTLHDELSCELTKRTYEVKQPGGARVFQAVQFILRFGAKMGSLKPHVLFKETKDPVVRHWFHSLTLSPTKTRWIDTTFISTVMTVLSRCFPDTESTVDIHLVASLLWLQDRWAHKVGFDETGTALFRNASFLRHSCHFNIDWTSSCPSEMDMVSKDCRDKTHVAQGRIKKKSELTMCFVPPMMAKEPRRQILDNLDIDCNCVLCTGSAQQQPHAHPPTPATHQAMAFAAAAAATASKH